MERKNEPIDVKNLQGVYPALITPMKFDEDAGIDYEKLYMLIDDLIAANVDGLLFLGTTGQSPTLTKLEKIGTTIKVFERVNGRVPLMIGAGSNSTKDAVELSRLIESRIGSTTFLHVTGYYNNPPQEGLAEHFRHVADSIDGNIIMYNVPSRTGNDLEAKTVIELAKHPKIIGLKEATGEKGLDKVSEITANTDPCSFRVLSGDCDQVVNIVERGGYGCISASANVAPRPYIDMTRVALEGEFTTARKIEENFALPIKRIVFIQKNPIPLAYMFGSNVRLPLVTLDKIKDGIYCKEVDETLARFKPDQLGMDLTKYRTSEILQFTAEYYGALR